MLGARTLLFKWPQWLHGAAVGGPGHTPRLITSDADAVTGEAAETESRRPSRCQPRDAHGPQDLVPGGRGSTTTTWPGCAQGWKLAIQEVKHTHVHETHPHQVYRDFLEAPRPPLGPGQWRFASSFVLIFLFIVSKFL